MVPTAPTRTRRIHFRVFESLDALGLFGIFNPGSGADAGIFEAGTPPLTIVERVSCALCFYNCACAGGEAVVTNF